MGLFIAVRHVVVNHAMNRPRRAFLTAIGSTAFAGCIGDSIGSSGPTVRDVSLLLNWKPSGLHVPYYAAKAEGYYEQEGMTVSDIESGQGSDFSAKQAALGNSSFAVTSSDQVINVGSRGLSPLAVGVMMQQSPVVVFTVRKNFGETFTSADQLTGSTVGSGPGMVRILTKLLLEREGVLDAVEYVDTGYDTVQRLLSGEIDAAGGVFGDAIAARYQGFTTDVVPVASAVPSYGHVVATEKGFADEHPETVRAFLRATARGAAWATRNPKMAIDHLIEAVPALNESRERQRAKWQLMSEQYVMSTAVREHGWGWSKPKPWDVTYDALRSSDLLGETVDPRQVWTNEYLDTESEYIGSYAGQVSGAR